MPKMENLGGKGRKGGEKGEKGKGKREKREKEFDSMIRDSCSSLPRYVYIRMKSTAGTKGKSE